MNRIKSYKNDVAFGKKAQTQIIEKLRTFFGANILENKERFATYDGFCKETKTNFEIKARRCSLSSFSTTIVPYSKIVKKKKDEKLIFVFSFTEGIYYIEFDTKLFGTFATEDIIYYRDGISPNSVKHLCIPCEYLLEMKS